MKKLIPFIMTAFMLVSFVPTQLAAGTNSRAVKITVTKTESIKTHALLARLDEIRAMDFKTLSSPQKRDLRQELRSLKSQFAAIGGYVYISAGAVIVILLILLLLL